MFAPEASEDGAERIGRKSIRVVLVGEMAELYAALSQVVASRADAARMLQCLEKFHKELKGARKEIIRDAYDSVMLPLVLIIQSCARVKKDADAEVQVPAAKSDRVVESALGELLSYFVQLMFSVE